MKRGAFRVLLLAVAFLVLQQLSAIVRPYTLPVQSGEIVILDANGRSNPVVNENSQISLMVVDASGRPITSGVTFESGSPEIATVDPVTGVVRGVQRGFATITARVGTATVSEFIVVARVSKGNGKKVLGDQEVDTSGAIYLSDPQQRVIYKRERAGAATVVFAGQVGVKGNKDGQRTQAQFASPVGVAVDNRAQGGVYVADSLNHSIRKIDFLDQVTTVLGTGAPGINRDDVTPFERVAFSSPQGVAVDSGGNLFIADTDNHAIYVADFAKRELRLLAGSPGQAGKADGQGRQALFNKPIAISLRTASTTGFGSSDRTALLVADSSNNRIRLVTLDGRVQTIGTQPSGRSPIAPQQQVEFEFRNPQSVSFDTSGNIYVVDDGGVSVVTEPLNSSRQLVSLAQPAVSFGQPVSVLASGNEVLVLDAGAASDGESVKSVTVGAPEILLLSQDTDRMQGGAEIDVVGRNFAPESIVILGDTVAPEAKILSATRISFKVPPQDAPGKRTLSIITRGGVAQRVFSITPPGFDELRVGEITTIAGGVPFLGDSGRATLAALNSPQGLFIDGNGQILIADTASNRIRRVDNAGVITTIAGNGVSGSSGDGGSAISASLDTPVSVVIDASGNIYTSDSRGHRIRRIDGITGIITTYAGTGENGYSGDGGPANRATLSFPLGLALDSTGNLYIADSSNSCIRRIDARSGIITTIAGTGQPGFSGDNGLATSALLSFPESLAIDAAGNIAVMDRGNNRIRRIDTRTGFITTIAGNGEFRFNGDGQPALQTALDPIQAVYDREGNLLIADLANNRIRRLSASTGIITTIAGDGVNRFAGDGGSATSASFSFPAYVTLDAMGNLYIADQINQRVRRVEASSGIINTIVGSSVDIGDGGSALDAIITNPSDVLLDSAGNLIIVDTENAVVRRMGLTTGLITRLAGTGELGSTGDGGLATAATFLLPLKGALDKLGNLYIVDSLARRVRRIDRSGVITTVAGSGTYGYSGDGGAAVNAELAGPQGVAVDSSGNIYIADTENHCIRRVDLRGIITTIAGNPNEPGFAGDGRPASNARFILPLALAVDSSNNLYITDAGNKRVRRIDATTGIISTVAGSGEVGSKGDGGPATAASFGLISGITVDSEGNLIIIDSTSHRIRRVNARTGIITTIAGTGVAGYTGDGTAATSAKLNRPKGAVVDSSGNAYIAAGFNSSIRVIRNTSGGGPRPDFSLNVTPSVQSVTTGSTAIFTVSLQAINDFNLPVSLNATVTPPTGLTTTFAPASITPGTRAELRVNAASQGNYTITVTGVSGQLTRTRTVSVRVLPPNSPPSISPIENQVVKTGQVVTLRVSATDPDGNNGLKLSLASALSYVTLTDEGNGSGELRIAPAIGDQSGSVVVQATDPLGLTAQVSFSISVQSGVTIFSASYTKPLLTISGSGFGATGATVVLNGRNVTSFIQSQSDTTIVLKGTKKKLGLIKGVNQLSVTANGATANTSFNF